MLQFSLRTPDGEELKHNVLINGFCWDVHLQYWETWGSSRLTVLFAFEFTLKFSYGTKWIPYTTKICCLRLWWTLPEFSEKLWILFKRRSIRVFTINHENIYWAIFLKTLFYTNLSWKVFNWKYSNNTRPICIRKSIVNHLIFLWSIK